MKVQGKVSLIAKAACAHHRSFTVYARDIWNALPYFNLISWFMNGILKYIKYIYFMFSFFLRTVSDLTGFKKYRQ